MALAFTLLFSIKDRKDKISTTEINLPSSLSLADVTAFGVAMAPLINNLITGQIVRMGVAIDLALPGGLRATPGQNSDVEEGARFAFKTQNNFITSLRIPTFDETNIAPNTRLVNNSNAPVAAFLVAMQLGISSSLPCDKRGEDIIELDSALESFQSSRK